MTVVSSSLAAFLSSDSVSEGAPLVLQCLEDKHPSGPIWQHNLYNCLEASAWERVTLSTLLHLSLLWMTCVWRPMSQTDNFKSNWCCHTNACLNHKIRPVNFITVSHSTYGKQPQPPVFILQFCCLAFVLQPASHTINPWHRVKYVCGC